VTASPSDKPSLMESVASNAYYIDIPRARSTLLGSGL
jgi:hypothetical protein